MNKLIVKATKDYSQVVFTWNNELTECDYVSIGVEDNELENLLNNNVHEGKDLEGWIVTVS